MSENLHSTSIHIISKTCYSKYTENFITKKKKKKKKKMKIFR